jgi:hypothetical protein
MLLENRPGYHYLWASERKKRFLQIRFWAPLLITINPWFSVTETLRSLFMSMMIYSFLSSYTLIRSFQYTFLAADLKTTPRGIKPLLYDLLEASSLRCVWHVLAIIFMLFFLNIEDSQIIALFLLALILPCLLSPSFLGFSFATEPLFNIKNEPWDAYHPHMILRFPLIVIPCILILMFIPLIALGMSLLIIVFILSYNFFYPIKADVIANANLDDSYLD